MRIERSLGKLIWITLAVAVAVACIAILGFVDLSKYLGPQREEKEEISQTDTGREVPGILNEKDLENQDKGALRDQADRVPGLQVTEAAKNRNEAEQSSDKEPYQHEEELEHTVAEAHNGLKVSNNTKLQHGLFPPKEREEAPKGESTTRYTPIEKRAEKGQDQLRAKDRLLVSGGKGYRDKASMPGKESHRTLKSIEFWTTEDGFKLMLVADTPIRQYKAFFLADPSRLVIDLAGKWKISNQDEVQVKNSRVKRIRFGAHENKLRIVADLNDSTRLTLTTDELPYRLNLIVKDL